MNGTTTRRKTALLASAAIAISAITVIVIAYPRHPGFVYWRDKSSRLQIWLEESGFIDNHILFIVEHDGRRQESIVLDKSSFGTARLVRRDSKVLAVNDVYIFAEYDLKSDTIIGYHRLPVTVWDGRGEVLDKARIGERAAMRHGFPIIAATSPSQSRPQPSSSE